MDNQKIKDIFSILKPIIITGSIKKKYQIAFNLKSLVNELPPPEEVVETILLITIAQKQLKYNGLDRKKNVVQIQIGENESAKGLIKVVNVVENQDGDESEKVACVHDFDLTAIIGNKETKIDIRRDGEGVAFVLEVLIETLDEFQEDDLSEDSFEFGDIPDQPIRKTAGPILISNRFNDLKASVNLGKSMPLHPDLKSSQKSGSLLHIDEDGSDFSSMKEIMRIEEIKPLQLNKSNKSNKSDESLNLSPLKQRSRIMKSNFLDPGHNENLDQDYSPSLLKDPNFNNSLSMSCPGLLQEYQRQQFEMLGEELIKERRKAVQYQQKMQHFVLKMNVLKNRNYELNEKWKEFNEVSQRFLDFVKVDKNGQGVIEVSEMKEKVSLNYKVSEQSEKAYANLLDFLVKMSHDHDHVKKGNEEEIISMEKILAKILELQHKNHSKLEQKKELEEKLKTLEKDKALSIENLQLQCKEKATLIEKCNRNIDELNKRIRCLQKQNNELKDIIERRQESLNKFKKVLMENNSQIDDIEEELINERKIVSNFELLIEELKEQIQFKDDIIENYSRESNIQPNFSAKIKKQSQKIFEHIENCVQWANNNETQNKRVDRNLIIAARNTEYLMLLEKQEAISIHEELQRVNNAVEERLRDFARNQGK